MTSPTPAQTDTAADHDLGDRDPEELTNLTTQEHDWLRAACDAAMGQRGSEYGSTVDFLARQSDELDARRLPMEMSDHFLRIITKRGATIEDEHGGGVLNVLDALDESGKARIYVSTYAWVLFTSEAVINDSDVFDITIKDGCIVAMETDDDRARELEWTTNLDDLLEEVESTRPPGWEYVDLDDVEGLPSARDLLRNH